MIRKPQYRVARRVGEAIFSKCQNPKFAASQFPEKKKTSKHRSNVTEYGTQLKEKQKIRLSYGVTEGKMRSTMRKIRGEKGLSAELLMQSLDKRLDNAVFRAGLAKTRVQARQYVSHGHILVNGKASRVPSREVAIGDVLTVRKESMERETMKSLPTFGKYTPPKWLLREAEATIAVRGNPSLADADTTLAWSAVTEFYSRS